MSSENQVSEEENSIFVRDPCYPSGLNRWYINRRGPVVEASLKKAEDERLQMLCEAWLAASDITLLRDDSEEVGLEGDEEETQLLVYHYSTNKGVSSTLKGILDRHGRDFWEKMKAIIDKKRSCGFYWCEETKNKYEWLYQELEGYIRGSQQDTSAETQAVLNSVQQVRNRDEAYESDMKELSRILREKRNGPTAVVGWTLLGSGAGVGGLGAVASFLSPHIAWLLPFVPLCHHLILIGVIIAIVGIIVLCCNEKFNDPTLSLRGASFR